MKVSEGLVGSEGSLLDFRVLSSLSGGGGRGKETESSSLSLTRVLNPSQGRSL